MLSADDDELETKTVDTEEEEEDSGRNAAARRIQAVVRGMLTRRRLAYALCSRRIIARQSGEVAEGDIQAAVHTAPPLEASLVRTRGALGASARAVLAGVHALDDALFPCGERSQSPGAATRPTTVRGDDSKLAVRSRLRLLAATSRLAGADARRAEARGVLELLMGEEAGHYRGLPPEADSEGYRSLMLQMTLKASDARARFAESRDAKSLDAVLGDGCSAYLDRIVERLSQPPATKPGPKPRRRKKVEEAVRSFAASALRSNSVRRGSTSSIGIR